MADLAAGTRFLRHLPRFLGRPVGLAEARATVESRLRDRGARFLHLMRRAVYGNPTSPYRALLVHAGCTAGDLERLVEREGLPATLGVLLDAGVYLTVEEVKGRHPVRRGALTIEAGPARLRHPAAARHLPLRSGGSRGSAVAMDVDLAFMRETNPNHACALAARGGTGWVHALWDVPGGAALIRLLRLAGTGMPVERWFSQIDPAASALHPRYRWAARTLVWGSRLSASRVPTPIHVPLADPLPILHWIDATRAGGHAPHLVTSVSAALRLAQAARARGMALTGLHLTIGGEPVTEARLAEIGRTGARAVPAYGSSDTGTAMAYGCLRPEAADDMHLFDDLFEVIQPDARALPGLPRRALLFTALGARAPRVLVNASLGDEAETVHRACHCPIEGFGWRRHLRAVRSFEKLTLGGMNLLDVDLLRVLDEVLPARFGGGPTHYQLIEEDGPGGHPRLRLLVDPAVGPVEPRDVASTFLDAIDEGQGIERITSLTWRAGGFLTVERRPPESRRGDKILHLLSGASGSR
jgi:hypothetical protein